MANITTREVGATAKGTTLSNAEIDNNFINLNTELGTKQDALVSGTSIKTVNNQSVLGSGNIQIDGGVTSFNTRTGAITLGAADVPGLDASKIISGTISADRLPSYVDDVVEAANLAAFPATGETGKIYVALDTNKVYRWSGSTYVYITSGAVDSVAGKTGVVTLTNSDVGLGNVENKSSATIRGELTSANVTGALGFTPYNSTNPSGYITSSALSSYLPLSGGTLTGTITAPSGQSRFGNVLVGNGSYKNVITPIDDVNLNILTPSGATYTTNLLIGGNQVLHASNYSSYALPLSGGTVSGYTTFSADVNMTSTGSYLPGHFYTNTHDGTNVYFHVGGSGSTTNKVLNLRVMNNSGGNSLYQFDVNRLDAPNLQINGNQVLHAGNFASYVQPNTGRVRTFTIDSLGAAGTQARRYEIARIAIDYNDWNSTGSFEVELFETYFAASMKKRYQVTYGYGGQNYATLVEMIGGGTNSFQVTVGSPVQVSGDHYYLPVYVDVRYYAACAARITTSRYISTASTPGIGEASVFVTPGGVDISDFSPDSTVNMSNSASAWQVGGNTVLHSGNYSSYALPLSGGTLSGSRPIQLETSGGSVIITGDSGGWGMGLYFKGSDNVIKGSFGALGGGAGFSYLWAGVDYSDNWMRFSSSAVNSLVALQQSGNQVLHAGNYTGYSGIVRALGYPSSGNDWNALGNDYANSVIQVDPSNFSSTSNGPTAASYTYGTLLNLSANSSSQSQIFISHAGNDLIFRGGWGGASWQTWNKVLTNQNYSSYSPTLTGGNASGTWPINITGSAGSVAATATTNLYSPNAATVVSGDASTAMPSTGQSLIHTLATGPSGNDGHIIGMSWANTTTIYGAQIWMDTDPTNRMAIRSRSSTGVWNGFWEVLTAGNYTSYSPGLTGSGASGTWGISVTGSANSLNLGGHTITNSSWAGGSGYHGYQYNGGNYRFGFSSTGGVLDVYADGNFYATDSSHLVLHAGNWTNYVQIPYTGWPGSPGADANTFLGGSWLRSSFTYSNNAPWTGPLFSAPAGGYDLQINGQYSGHEFSIRSRNGDAGSWMSWKRILTDHNYNTWTPTLTGGGASGTWSISITGNAATAYGLNVHGGRNNEANRVVRTDGNGYLQTGYINSSNGDENNSSNPDRVWGTNGSDSYLRTYRTSSLSVNYAASAGSANSVAWSNVSSRPTWMTASSLIATHSNANDWQNSGFYENGGSGSNWPNGSSTWYNSINVRHSNQGNYHGFQLAMSYYDNFLYWRSYQGSGTFQTWARGLSDQNYNSYSPTLTGGGASGTWGISISGNSATTSQTTFSEVYTNGWLRNNSSGTGLYNQATGNHWYSDGQYWNVGYSGTTGIRLRNGHAGTILGYLYGETDGNFGLLHNGGGWAVQVYSGGNGYLHGTWNGGNIRANRANGNFYIDDNYGCGIVGAYASTRYQGVFFMGDSYKMSADGTSLANMYGIGWSHPNAGGAAGNLTDHGMLIINNGGFRCAISNSIVASANITAYSDERLKTNWRDMPDNYVARLAQVKVGIYDRTDEQELMTQVGVGAQSFQKLLPQAIMTAKDEMGTLSVSYGNAALASAVELAKDNVELRARIERLESLIEQLLNKE